MAMKRLGLAGLVMAATVGGAVAQDQGLTGYWSGTYDCAQGLTGINLTIRQGFGVTVEAVFHFYPVPQNPKVPIGCFKMLGRHDPETREFVLESDESQWLEQPQGYVTVNFRGMLGAGGRSMRGQVEGPGCAQFELQRLERPPLAPPACSSALNISGDPMPARTASR